MKFTDRYWSFGWYPINPNKLIHQLFPPNSLQDGHFLCVSKIIKANLFIRPDDINSVPSYFWKCHFWLSTTSVLCHLVLEVKFQFWTALLPYTSNSDRIGKAVDRCIGHCCSTLVSMWSFLFITGVWGKVYKTVKSKYFHSPLTF